MEIGIKLDVGCSGNEAYRRLYGGHEILRFLHGAGVRAVEVPIGPEINDNQLLEHVEECCDAGLHVSFHPYTEGLAANPAFFSPSRENPCRLLHERFMVLAAEAAERQQAETILNIHPAAGAREESRDSLVDQSVRFFQWAREWCGAHTLAVRPVAELQIRPNPEESIQRIGDDYSELLEIVERSQVDACWDFGHAFMNSRRFGVPPDPPHELLRRVVHVHCHDADRQDHQPLVFETVPWRRFFGSLNAVGFNGAVILEVPPEHFLSAGGIDTVMHSIHIVTERIRSTPAPGPA